jgi:branched-chain amino acid transport system substrate-binding protein
MVKQLWFDTRYRTTCSDPDKEEGDIWLMLNIVETPAGEEGHVGISAMRPNVDSVLIESEKLVKIRGGNTMRKRRKSWLWILSVISVLALAACKPPSGANPASGGSGKGDNTVTIGYTGPLSGGAADYGKNVLSGIEMAVKEINKNGGVKVNGKEYKINLKALDDQYQPNKAAMNAQKFVQEYNTPIIFTSHSGGVLAMQEFNESNKFIIGAYTSEPQVTARGNKLTIRIPPAYDGYMEPYSQYGMEKFGKHLGMAPTNSAYGKAWTKLFKKAWEENKGKIVALNEMDYNNDASFNTGVSKTLSAKPDFLFVGGPSEPTALVIKEARQLGYKGGFAIMDQAKLNEMAKVLGGYDMLNGSIGVIPLESSGKPATNHFIQNYKKAYHKIPNWEAAWNYMAMYVFADAMTEAGTIRDVEKIRGKVESAMKHLPKDQQIADLQGLDPNGGWISKLTIGKVENGKITKVKLDDE